VLVDDWHLAWVQEMQQERDRDEARLASEVSIDSNLKTAKIPPNVLAIADRVIR